MNPCIEWTGCKMPNGYGKLGRNGKTLLAHRVAYCQARNISIEAIDGLMVRHKCDNRACINPEHLEIGTHADNMADMVSRGRQRSVPLQGSKHGMAKLTEDDVREARRLHASGKSAASIARQFGLAASAMHRTLRGNAWRHV